MPTTDYPLPGSGDHPRPASFGTAPQHPTSGPPISAWIDEPATVRLVESFDGCTMPVVEIIGSGKRVHIGLDSSLPGGSRTARMLRAALDAYERRLRLRAAGGLDDG